jgi:LPXTG-motif cell wall-anchored protein
MKRTILAVLGLAVLFAAGLGVLHVDNVAAGYEHKVTICHYPPGNPENRHTIEVDKSALEAHYAHGDYKGECQPGMPTDPTTTETTTTTETETTPPNPCPNGDMNGDRPGCTDPCPNNPGGQEPDPPGGQDGMPGNDRCVKDPPSPPELTIGVPTTPLPTTPETTTPTTPEPPPVVEEPVPEDPQEPVKSEPDVTTTVSDNPPTVSEETVVNAGAETLPHTGLSLWAAVLIGLSLAALGSFLVLTARRR